MDNLLWKSDLGNGEYKNPILFADYSDPDVIRVEDTYYMTASSFNYIPGLPILTSKDMVNWTLVNYALDRIPYPDYDLPQHSKGVWAPAIRFHEGEFYIYYGMPDEGIFMVKTKNPLGKWEEPVCVLAGKGLIDSCPFWDEDGKAYVIHGYANSRIGFKSHLGIFEMSPDGKKAISEDHILYCGLETQPTIEGPKVYKLNGYYYVLAPAGGVKPGWQTALRAKNIYGPYEEQIICKQGSTDINGPHQGALIDDINGKNWWFIHFQDMGLYGRVCHLQPVTWKDNWPIVGTPISDYCGEPVRTYKKPECNTSENPTYLEASDDFSSDKVSLCWQWMGNVSGDDYSLSEKGRLKLYSTMSTSLWQNSNVLTQKLVCPNLSCNVGLDYSNLGEGDIAGLMMMGGEYSFVGVTKENGSFRLIYGTSTSLKAINGFKPSWLVIDKEEPVTFVCNAPGENINLGILFDKEQGYQVNYDLGDGQKVIEESKEFYPSDHTWVGAKLGLFCYRKSECKNDTRGYAAFYDFKVEAL